MEQHRVSLMIHASFDDEREAVGLYAEASSAFDDGENTRAKIEVLAAIAAKANAIAADVIRTWDVEEQRRKELVDHFAGLKEQMLSDMLEQVDKAAE